MTVLELIIVIFLFILFAAISVFTFYFLSHQFLLKKEFKIKNEFNKISMIIASTNFIKMDIIAQNSLILQNKVDMLKSSFDKIKSNNLVLKESIQDFSMQNKRMNLQGCFNKYKKLHNDVEILKNQFTNFKKQSKSFVEYSDQIAIIFNVYREIFIVIDKFYQINIVPNYEFKEINLIINEIKNDLHDLDDLSTVYDFEKTVQLVVKLRKKILLYYFYCQRLYTLKKIRIYANNNIDIINQTIENNYERIENTDFENVTKLIAITNDYQKKFIIAFDEFRLKNAYEYSIDLIRNVEQLNNFIFLSLNSVNLIDQSTKIINKEIAQIINTHTAITKQLDVLYNYFSEDDTLLKQTKSITQGFKDVIDSFNTINDIRSRSYNEKKNHLEKINTISRKINSVKQIICESIDKINEAIKDSFTLIQRINDLTFSLYQIQAYIFTYKTQENDEQILQADIQLIDYLLNCLKELQNHVLQLEVLTKDEIEIKLQDINAQIGMLVQKINASYIASNYAIKLLTYANRFLTNDLAKEKMNKVMQEFEAKNFFTSVDLLIEFINEFANKKSVSK